MGACLSSPNTRKSPSTARNAARRKTDLTIGRPLTTKVVHVDGRVQEFEHPIPARNIISKYPNSFLCSSDSLSVRTCAPRLPEEEELRPGQIYFLLPMSLSNKCLSLPDLCNLAIKASSAIGEDEFY